MKKQKETHKDYQFEIKLLSALQETIFNEDSEYYCSEEIKENPTDFIHALANTVPCHLYNKITSEEEVDILGFNHLANRLILQNVQVD